MERKEIFDKLTEIFRDIMDNNEIVLEETTSSTDIDEWDSLAQTLLLAEIQKTYGIRFKLADTIRWKNVGEMVDSIIELITNVI